MEMSVGYMQRRIISSFVSRNTRGWGRPLTFWRDRIRMGSYFGACAVAFFIINVILNHGVAGVWNAQNGTTVFLNILTIFAFAYFLWVFFTYLIPMLRATSQPSQTITGTVQVAICNAREFVPIARDIYHFITVRLPNGTLRAFAIDPALHDQVCQAGKEVHLIVTPGIERVDVAE
jgi:uncharacterized protein with PQ loop repeat